mmetsp:Transcript_30098/g.70175  ORF Transcript_30098/g.70175 Transcript_30098/m.70175 type:complete len:234 (-) Transcript_30098:1081-1782(-)
MPNVTGEGATLRFLMSCTVASNRLKSFRRQQVSSKALIRTWSTSFGCCSMNLSTRAMPRYTLTGLIRLLPSPNVFISMRDTVNLSVVTPRRCMSSRAFQASSTPFRRIKSSKAFADPLFGLILSPVAFFGLSLSESRPDFPPLASVRAGVATESTGWMPRASCSVFSNSSTASLSCLSPAPIGVFSEALPRDFVLSKAASALRGKLGERCSSEKQVHPPCDCAGGSCKVALSR